jgi:hypothetical protein
MLELPGPYQVVSTLSDRPVVIHVRDHRVLADGEIVFDHQVYDVDEDCLLTPTPDQARAIWNILMADLETICQSSHSQDETGGPSS